MSKNFIQQDLPAQLQRLSWLRMFYYFWLAHGKQMNDSTTQKIGIKLELTDIELSQKNENNESIWFESVWPVWGPIIDRGTIAIRWMTEFLNYPKRKRPNKEKDSIWVEDFIARPDFEKEAFTNFKIEKHIVDKNRRPIKKESIDDINTKKALIEENLKEMRKYANKLIAHPTTYEQEDIPYDKFNLCAAALYHLTETTPLWSPTNEFQHNSIIIHLQKICGDQLNDFVIIEKE